MTFYKLMHSNDKLQIAGHIVYRDLNTKGVYEECIMSSHGYIISIKEFTDSMEGIYTTSVNSSTLDEAPQAYKPIEEIKSLIVDTVEIVDTIKPLYNFKAN